MNKLTARPSVWFWRPRIVQFSAVALLVLHLVAPVARAQVPPAAIDSLGVAQSFPILEPSSEVKNGLIISHRNSQYGFSSEAYDKNMFGVVTLEPAISFTGSTNVDGDYPIVTTGTVLVLVTAENGQIQAGDRLTSSNLPGIAMKATKSGFTLGVAKAAHTDTSTPGYVPVSLEIKFTFAEDSPESEKISARLKDLVSLSAIASIESPTQALRHVVAAISLVGSIGFAIFSFMKSAQKGIDALGRNPLAKSSISLGILINAVISTLILICGIAGAYFILTI